MSDIKPDLTPFAPYQTDEAAPASAAPASARVIDFRRYRLGRRRADRQRPLDQGRAGA
ncbi:hypothetical protein [Azospirillum brasilense]|uniref:hypothetical protein n=1 Tax=Azospirillum brasilense TaxID=192 RepID=UPI0016592E65|nr:hypothetical protein [Azospirillum brasilense]